MPAVFFFRNLVSTVGGAGGRVASQTSGATAANAVTTTTASGTNIPVTATAGGQALTWFTQPITVQVSIPSTANQVNASIQASESAASVNAGVAITIERCDNSGTVLSNILTSTVIGAELLTAQGTRSASFAVTATTMNVGERIKFTVRIVNVGTMGAGTATVFYNASGASTRVTFTPDIITDEIIEINQYQGGGTYGYN
jgi:hypothetical protein